MYAALIVSSSDLREVQHSVSTTGCAGGCASLVFDLCLCAGGSRGKQLLQNDCCFGTRSQGQGQTGWVDLGKVSSHPEPCLAHLYSGAGPAALAFLGGFQRDD